MRGGGVGPCLARPDGCSNPASLRPALQAPFPAPRPGILPRARSYAHSRASHRYKTSADRGGVLIEPAEQWDVDATASLTLLVRGSTEAEWKAASDPLRVPLMREEHPRVSAGAKGERHCVSTYKGSFSREAGGVCTT